MRCGQAFGGLVGLSLLLAGCESGPEVVQRDIFATLSVDVRRGVNGAGGWILSISDDEVVRYRSRSLDGGTLEGAWARDVPEGSYAAIRAMAEREIADHVEYVGPECDGYLADVIFVQTSGDTADGIKARCPHGPTVAARNRVARAILEMVGQ